jgi:hypothetical protein
VQFLERLPQDRFYGQTCPESGKCGRGLDASLMKRQISTKHFLPFGF